MIIPMYQLWLCCLYGPWCLKKAVKLDRPSLYLVSDELVNITQWGFIYQTYMKVLHGIILDGNARKPIAELFMLVKDIINGMLAKYHHNSLGISSWLIKLPG